jgi:hypothetical protein
MSHVETGRGIGARGGLQLHASPAIRKACSLCDMRENVLGDELDEISSAIENGYEHPKGDGDRSPVINHFGGEVQIVFEV